jgi:hypothetical protein
VSDEKIREPAQSQCRRLARGAGSVLQILMEADVGGYDRCRRLRAAWRAHHARYRLWYVYLSTRLPNPELRTGGSFPPFLRRPSHTR